MYSEVLKKIYRIQIKEEELTFNSNIVLLNMYYGYILKNFGYKISQHYLDLFTNIDNLKPSYIEQNFSNLILDNFNYNLYDFEKFENKGGIYILFQYDYPVYVGKSNNLGKRAIQSYINKLPYGVEYIKILPITLKDIFESVCIHYFKPIYNQRIEKIDIDIKYHREIIQHVTDYIDNSNESYTVEFEDSLITNVWDH